MPVLEINATDLKIGLERGEIKLIDVREEIENAEERIDGSTLIPLSRFDATNLLSNKGNQKLVLHCRSGKRSMQAAQKLIEAGYPEVYSLQGGIEAWKANGYKVNKSSTPQPISLMRQVQITAGLLVLIGLMLSRLVNENFIWLSAFVGAGLVFAGITNTCGLGMLLAQMSWNKVSSNTQSRSLQGRK